MPAQPNLQHTICCIRSAYVTFSRHCISPASACEFGGAWPDVRVPSSSITHSRNSSGYPTCASQHPASGAGILSGNQVVASQSLEISMATMAGVMPMLHLYRHILKAAKHFPSRKRDSIYTQIKTEFKCNKDLTAPDAVAQARRVAERGLSDLEAYLPSRRGPDGSIDITLKGATD